jgi:hypothetical protein
MAEGVCSVVRDSRVPGFKVRRSKAAGPTTAWRAIMFAGLPGFADNPYVVTPVDDAGARDAMMPACTCTLRETLVRSGSSMAAHERERLAKAVLRCMCRALHIMHRAGVVHGDISATNIMQRPDGIWVLIDVDLAQVGFCTGRAIGSPATMPPEAQADPDLYRLGRKVSRHVRCAADLWALGCVMEQILPAEHQLVEPLKRLSPLTRELPFWVDDALFPACRPPSLYVVRWSSEYADQARPNLIEQVRDLFDRQPPYRQSDELLCIAIQLLDVMCMNVSALHACLPRVCVHAASFVCTEAEAPVDCVVEDDAYLTLLLCALKLVPQLPIGLQDPRLVTVGTLDALIYAPTRLFGYILVTHD